MAASHSGDTGVVRRGDLDPLAAVRVDIERYVRWL
jgi:hypothetical protein